MKIIWFDDNPAREKYKELIESNYKGVTVKFSSLKNESNPESIIIEALKSNYDLIVLDEYLTNFKSQINKGSIFSEIIIKNNSKSFIIGITANTKFNDVKDYEKEPYDLFFEEKDFIINIPNIFKLANDYHKLISLKLNHENDILNKILYVDNNFINAHLLSIIPERIKNDINSLLSKRYLFRWIYNVLLQRPGFLYDSLWMATFLGLKNNSFKKVESFFITAKYSGLFNTDENSKWWLEEVKSLLFTDNILFENLSSNSIEYWQRGRCIKGISKSDHSKCEITKEEHPENVAFKDTSTRKRIQVKNKYTKLDPRFESLLHFDELRVYNDDLR